MESISQSLVPEGDRIADGVLRAEALKEVEHARSIRIASAEDHRISVETFKALKEKIKLLTERSKAIGKKHDDAKKEALADYKASLAACEAAADMLARAIADYQDGQSAREQAAANAYGKALAEGRAPDKDALVAVFSNAPTAKLVVQETWCFEVEKPELVPPAFLAPDEKKIGAFVRAMKADAKIPGVRVWVERTAKNTDAAETMKGA